MAFTELKNDILDKLKETDYDTLEEKMFLNTMKNLNKLDDSRNYYHSNDEVKFTKKIFFIKFFFINS